jgi:uncharacterized membrane protein
MAADRRRAISMRGTAPVQYGAAAPVTKATARLANALVVVSGMRHNPFMKPPPLRVQARLRPRLLLALFTALGIYLLLPASWLMNTRLLCAWNAGALFYIVSAAILASRSSTKDMERRAMLEDEGAVAILALTITAGIASLASIAVEVHGISSAPAEERTLRLALAGFTILSSWFFVHTIYAIHYAHEFYRFEPRGLAFPHEDEPDYWDFLYFSFNMGAAAQTSDVTVINPRMRRLVLSHTVLAFLFNTTILALAINVGAGLI